MSYRVIQCQIAQDNLIYDYCDSNAQKAKLLYNAALFRIRQIFTGWDKDSRTDNEKEAFAEVTLLQQTFYILLYKNKDHFIQTEMVSVFSY